MKQTFVIATLIAGLIGSLWTGFSLGVYYQFRLASAFTANQVLLVRQMSVRREAPELIVQNAASIARRWEARSSSITLWEAFDPNNVPNLVGSSGRRMLLLRNKEAWGQPLPMADPR